MVNYEFFYDITEAWKGSFTPKEVAINAYEYLCEFETSLEDTPTESIKTLYVLLVEDGSEVCLDWAYTLASELGLVDMDYLDYLETDKEIIKKIMGEN